MTKQISTTAKTMASRTWLAGLAVIVVSTLFSTVPAAAAFDGNVTDQAVLTDGVSGLEVNRTTPIESEVWAIEAVGPYVLVGGAFLDVNDRSNYTTTPWPYLAAFDPTSGEHVPWFGTRPNGPVYDIVDLGDGRAIIAGEFTSVNGVNGTDKIAIIDVATGLVDTSFSFNFADSDDTVVRALATSGDWLYATGAFNRANGNGVAADTRGLARFSLRTGRLDTSWLPQLRGGDGFGIATASNGRVFVGGYFESVNGVEGTETFAALRSSDGALVPGWNHGFPYSRCAAGWRNTCGAVNGIAVTNDRIFVAGAKHFWAAVEPATGEVLVANEITNDGQSVDVVGGEVVIGCHCETSTFSNEFNNIAHRYVRVIDPVSLTETTSPTVQSRGAAGGWAAGGTDDGCLWSGGNFTSTFVNGVRHPAWNLLRFCPAAGPGANQSLPRPVSADTQAPSTPAAPAIAAVRGATVDLTWPSVPDNSGQLSYLVYRNGVLIGRTASNSYSDKLLDYSSDYYWQVAAVDMAGNQTELSSRSTPVRIGARINVARQGTATQISDFDATTLANRAIDNLLSTDPAQQLPSRTGDLGASEEPWINLDLGRNVHVDSIELHPRRDDDFRESNNRPRIFYNTTPIDASNRADASTGGHSVWQGDVIRDDGSPRIDLAPIAEQVRHLRIFNSMKRISFDEIRVYTARTEPTPAQPATDTTRPSDPRWARTFTRGEQSVLEWGGARDNIGVAYYEVTGPDGVMHRTATTRLSVGAPGALARDYDIVAVDAAGNRSRVAATPTAIVDCSVSRNDDGLTVSWAAAPGADRTIIRRSVDGGPDFWRGSVNAPATVFDDTDRSGTLNYTVEARFGAVTTTATTCSFDTPAAPTGLRVTREEARLVVLNYSGEGQAVEIERNGQIVGTDSDNWFVDRDLQPGTTYTYRVRFDAPGAEWSAGVTARTAGVALAAPATCSVERNGGTFDVTWSTANAADAYIVERRIDGGTWWWRGRVETTSFTDSDRAGAVEYRVRSVNATGASANRTCN